MAQVDRLVGNDKVPEEMRPLLRRIKAVRQGLSLRPARRWWPQLDGLDAQARDEVKAIIRDTFIWELSEPRFTTDGRRFA